MTKTKEMFLPLVVVFTILVSLVTPLNSYAQGELYEPRLEAPTSNNPYYSSKLNLYFQMGSPMPNCVAYAYGRLYEMNGEKPLFTHGSAGEWYGINKQNGYYDYGMEPKLGAVACWSGHVAIVEKIKKDGSITISESHWGGGYFDVRTYDNMFSHFGQTFYGYIYAYNEGVSRELEKKLLNADKPKNDVYMTPADENAEENTFEIKKFGLAEHTAPENTIEELLNV